MGPLRAFALLSLLAASPAARGDEARQLYEQGQSAFARRDFPVAYQDFSRAYHLTRLPALLYNMSTALLGMHRPHEAADSLRSYLLAQPSDPDRTAIEERIQTLDLLGPTAPPPFVLAPRPVPALLRLRVAVVVAVTVAAAVAIGAAVALGVALKPSLDPATPSTFGGPVTITR